MEIFETQTIRIHLVHETFLLIVHGAEAANQTINNILFFFTKLFGLRMGSTLSLVKAKKLKDLENSLNFLIFLINLKAGKFLKLKLLSDLSGKQEFLFIIKGTFRKLIASFFVE